MILITFSVPHSSSPPQPLPLTTMMTTMMIIWFTVATCSIWLLTCTMLCSFCQYVRQYKGSFSACITGLKNKSRWQQVCGSARLMTYRYCRVPLINLSIKTDLYSTVCRKQIRGARCQRLGQSINLFSKYGKTASIMNSGGRTTRQLNALTVALEKHK